MNMMMISNIVCIDQTKSEILMITLNGYEIPRFFILLSIIPIKTTRKEG